MIQYILHHPKRLFLMDGIGAIITALMNYAVLAPYEAFFGMPKNILYILTVAALGFAVYSWTCHIKLPKKPRKYIQIIASANLLYILALIILLYYFSASITLFGFLYFTGEIFVLSGIIAIEYKAARLSV